MDQLKEFLRQAIKYRFWIAVGISALLPMIAYFVGSSKIQAEATRQAADVKSANESGNVPNGQYKPIVTSKTEVLTSDVNAAWRKLYARQAPLLTWPEEPAEIAQSFAEWGRRWPEGVDPTAVQLIIQKYALAYPDYVTKVYQKLRPWDPVEGTGVVLAPPKEVLLQPYQFDEANLPTDLGKIWGAQEKLWVQAALLEVIDKVNKSAKDWDTAVIKQVLDIQVANPLALDQVAMANGETLREPDSFVRPGSEAPASTDASAATATGSSGSGYSAPASGKGGMAMAMGYGSGGMGGATSTPDVSYLSSSNEQYSVVPVSMEVCIDQNSINDLLVELANSPMAIQVIDYEQSRPPARLVKPVKGADLPGGMGGMGGMFNSSSSYGGRGRMGAGEMGYGSPGGYMSGGGAAKRSSGTSLRDKDRAKEREEKEKKKAENKVEVKIHDPYYNFVLVRIYGQARFYHLPPADQPAEPSAADTANEAPKADEAKTDAEPKADAAKEQPKADAPKGEGDAEPGKATPDENKGDAEPAKAESDKSKAEPPKAETPKEEAPKAGAPKTEAPKSDAGAPAPKR
jgi:hypothetical protein